MSFVNIIAHDKKFRAHIFFIISECKGIAFTHFLSAIKSITVHKFVNEVFGLIDTISHFKHTEILLYLLGDYATTISPESLAIKANKDSRTASPDIAKLAGTRLVVASEPPRRMLFDSSLVKTLTGRDTVSARFLHENEFQFKPKFKLILNSNYLPVISDKTVFSSNRVKVVPFERHFTEKEQNKGNVTVSCNGLSKREDNK